MFIDKYRSIHRRFDKVDRQLDLLQLAIGRIEARQTADASSMAESEFTVFSQWGEDGILQYLINKIEIENKIFVEFGVETYLESNTRFLLLHNKWAGLVIDGSQENIDTIKKSPYYWKCNLKTERSFITKDNINTTIKRAGIEGKIGLLSIDIDGNDYWVWEAINVVDPDIVVVEYNNRFGPKKSVTIPYSDNFVREEAHYSHIYYGASLKALCHLAKKKGYDLVGCDSGGVNAFFVKKSLRPKAIKSLSAEEGFVEGQFREARGNDGAMIFSSREEEIKILTQLPVVEISK